jgi:hypothetical protein
MDHTEIILFKTQLKYACKDLIEQRIIVIRQAIDAAQEAANSEEKSSAGDKYETGRAMGHLEKDLHARQLAETLKELAGLNAVHENTIYTRIQSGACVETDAGLFFIAAGLGKQWVMDRWVYLLSPHAPLAKLLESKKVGDHFIFKTTETRILELY